MNKKIIPLIAIAGLALAVNPIQWVSIVILCCILVYGLYAYFGHPALLVLIAARPALDILRSYGVVLQDTYISGTTLLGAISILWSIIIVYRYKEVLTQTIRLRTIALLVSSFLLFNIATTLWSVAPMTTLGELLHLSSIVLLFFVGAIFIQTKQVSLSTILQIILIGSILPILVGLWQLVSGTGIQTFSIQDRVYSTFAHPNVFALYILCIGCISWIWFQLKPLSRTPIITFFLPLLAVLILSTYTRAAWIGAIIFICIYGLFQHRRKTLIMISIIAATYLLFYPLNQVLIQVFNKSLTEYQLVSRIFERDEEADSVTWRLSVATDSLDIVREQPLQGFGYGTFPTVWEIRRDPAFVYDDSSEAHNDYLRLWVESGTIGLGLYLLLLGSLLWQSIQKSVRHHTQKEYLIHTFLISWTIMYAALSLSDNMLNHTAVAWTMWLVWGALIASKFKKDHFLA